MRLVREFFERLRVTCLLEKVFGPSVVVRNKFYRPYISLNLGQFSMKMELGKQLERNLNIRVRELQRGNVGGGGVDGRG